MKGILPYCYTSCSCFVRLRALRNCWLSFLEVFFKLKLNEIRDNQVFHCLDSALGPVRLHLFLWFALLFHCYKTHFPIVSPSSAVDSTFHANCHLATFATSFPTGLLKRSASGCLSVWVRVCDSIAVSFGHCLSSRSLAINFTISWQRPLKQSQQKLQGTSKEPPRKHLTATRDKSPSSFN